MQWVNEHVVLVRTVLSAQIKGMYVQVMNATAVHVGPNTSCSNCQSNIDFVGSLSRWFPA
jgi:hypothetical protein